MIGHLAAQPVTAQDEDISLPKRMGTFHIHLHERLWPQRANDDVARNALHRVRIDTLTACIFPDQAVIKAELLNLPIADTVGPAIPDVSDPGAVGSQEKGRRGRAHSLEFAVL